MKLYDAVREMIQQGAIVSAYALDAKGLAAAISKMAFGNKLGVTVDGNVSTKTLFTPGFGNIVAEVKADKLDVVKSILAAAGLEGFDAVVAEVNNTQNFVYGDMTLSMDEAIEAWTGTLEKVFPTKATDDTSVVNTGIYEAIEKAVAAEHGNRHSAHIHSKNIDNLTRFAREVETTIFVKNAHSYAGIGAGGEGYTTFTIAGPTGEGLTAAHSFTRQRRCVMVDGLHII